MANEYDYEGGSGSGFMMGLLTGTVLGAGLGMLFAPKSGSELRGQISETASKMGHTASESYQKLAAKANDIAERGRSVGREVADRAREAVSRGTEEARRYSSESPNTGSTSSGAPGGPYSSGPTRS